MAIRDTWRRALEYFGLVEGDYVEEGEYYDEGDTGPQRALDDTAVAPREAVGSRRRGREDDIDDIFGDEEPAPRRSRSRSVDDTMEEPRPRRGRRRAPAGNGGGGGGGGPPPLGPPRGVHQAPQGGGGVKRPQAGGIKL